MIEKQTDKVIELDYKSNISNIEDQLLIELLNNYKDLVIIIKL